MRQPSPEFEADLRWFDEHRRELARTYGEKYLAVVNKQVVDSDVDFSNLARRVYAKYGYRDLVMKWASEEERVYHVFSPQVARALSGGTM